MISRGSKSGPPLRRRRYGRGTAMSWRLALAAPGTHSQVCCLGRFWPLGALSWGTVDVAEGTGLAPKRMAAQAPIPNDGAAVVRTKGASGALLAPPRFCPAWQTVAESLGDSERAAGG